MRNVRNERYVCGTELKSPNILGNCCNHISNILHEMIRDIHEMSNIFIVTLNCHVIYFALLKGYQPT